MLREKQNKVKIAAPSDVGTHDTLTVALSDLGIADDLAPSLEVEIVRKRNSSSGADVTRDETIAISGTDIVITEGATGFATTDVFTVEIYVGRVPSVEATASTA